MSHAIALRQILTPMSQGNVEWVRKAHEYFAGTGEPFLEEVDPAIEVFDHDIPDASYPYRGVEGIGTWLSDFGESWERYEMAVDRIVDAGDQVVSLFRIRAVGAGSGVAVERGDGIVWSFRDGRLVRIDYFNDQELALRAAEAQE
jgi:ketosteroid isomerase-like protein